MSRKPLKIASLLLDLENPRIKKAGSQRDATQKILEDDVKLLALAESIVKDGLNPMDRLLVVKSPDQAGKYIAIEGNRRLAAMKLLSNPAQLADLEVRSPVRKALEKLAQTFDPAALEPIECYEVADRSDGAMWIQQRHTGENKGTGIVNWDGVARARFRGADPALQALDFVLENGELTEEERAQIESWFPITTFDRLLSTPAVRAKIGVSIAERKLKSSLPPEELIKPLRRMVRDLANEDINVTQLKKKEQQIEYVDSFGKDLPNLSKAKGEAKSVESLKIDEAPKGGKKSKPKAKGKKSPRRSLIPKDCQLNVSNAKIAEIVVELRKLNLEEHPNAISVLFRVFLETSIDDYLTRCGVALTEAHTGGGKHDKKLGKKFSEAVDQLVANGAPKKTFDGVTKAFHDKTNPLHVETLHNYVHNRFFTPTARDLTVGWNNAQPFFEGIWA